MTITLYTVDGTAALSETDPGQYPNQVAVALQTNPWQLVADRLDGLATPPSPWRWAPVPYPAATFPMQASINTGVSNLVGLIQSTPGQFALAGYSQGAIVTSTVWRDYILSPSGALHNRLDDIVAAVNWGNPMRCPGIANGNTYAGWPIPAGGGIAGTGDLTAAQTPDWWLDFANPNDLYTDSPVGTAAGTDESLIYNMVLDSDTLEVSEMIALIESVIKQFSNPLVELVGIVTAIINGLTFAAAGPAAGHYTYDIGPAIRYLTEIGQQQ